MVEDSRLSAASRASTLPARTLPAPPMPTRMLPTRKLWGSQVPGDRKQLAAGMTVTLSAELDDRVPLELIAEIVRAVLDDSRQAADEELAESVMFEARQRLGRFIRARTPR
jgi:hypothetical protein